MMDADKVVKFMVDYNAFTDVLTQICEIVFNARFALPPANFSSFSHVSDFDCNVERGGIMAFCEGRDYDKESIFLPVGLFSLDDAALIAYGESLREQAQKKEAEEDEKNKAKVKESRRMEYEQLKKEFEADIDASQQGDVK